MAEAFGVASGVAGFLSLGVTICQGLISYYASCKDAKSTVKRMYTTVEMLSKTFELLESSIKNKAFSQTIATQVETSIRSCKDGLECLEKKLEKIKLSSKLAIAIYPFRESTLVKLMEISNDLRDNLGLALNALQM